MGPADRCTRRHRPAHRVALGTARQSGSGIGLGLPRSRMKVALVNPPWSFDGSIYFGCREPHLPLELGYAKALLERDGHDVLLIDAQLGLRWHSDGSIEGDVRGDRSIRSAIASFGPDATAITTAPSYLFWRCAPPELRVPMRTVSAIRDVAGTTI